MAELSPQICTIYKGGPPDLGSVSQDPMASYVPAPEPQRVAQKCSVQNWNKSCSINH